MEFCCLVWIFSTFGSEVMEFLNENYERRWNGRIGSVAWSAQSPDLNPLDFFLWGCMKSRVYEGGEPEGRHQLVEAINEVAIAIGNELVRMQWQHSMVQQLAACIQCDGGHFKHAL